MGWRVSHLRQEMNIFYLGLRYGPIVLILFVSFHLYFIQKHDTEAFAIFLHG